MGEAPCLHPLLGRRVQLSSQITCQGELLVLKGQLHAGGVARGCQLALPFQPGKDRVAGARLTEADLPDVQSRPGQIGSAPVGKASLQGQARKLPIRLPGPELLPHVGKGFPLSVTGQVVQPAIGHQTLLGMPRVGLKKGRQPPGALAGQAGPQSPALKVREQHVVLQQEQIGPQSLPAAALCFTVGGAKGSALLCQLLLAGLGRAEGGQEHQQEPGGACCQRRDPPWVPDRPTMLVELARPAQGRANGMRQAAPAR